MEKQALVPWQPLLRLCAMGELGKCDLPFYIFTPNTHTHTRVLMLTIHSVVLGYNKTVDHSDRTDKENLTRLHEMWKSVKNVTIETMDLTYHSL